MISSSFSYSSSLSASRTIALPMSHVSLVESDGLISCIYIFSRDKSDSIEINTAVFLGKMCSGRHKNHDCGLNKPEGTSSAMFDVGTAAKCYEFKRYVLQLDVTRVKRVTRVTNLRRTRVFFPRKWVRTVTKTMVVDRKQLKALALLCLA